MDLKGLLPFSSCTVHVVHNGFHKGIGQLTQGVDQLAFELHAWFNSAPCKEEDFLKLSDSTVSADETLAPTLE